ncbi:MAG: GPW/gp25 family protein [Caldilineales bacterium]|nr:GPW/gp25 family protein [Caldilineales bacterium]MDW8318317.1 GPW/gp25 family protein [Anaerolineae bacterium]
MATPAKLYGQGIGFPPRVAPNGQMVWSAGELNVRESICIILRTRPGERLMRPDFGCGLDRYLFEPATVSTLRLIQEEVKAAVQRWEPRVALDDVIVATHPTDPRVVDITVVYTLIATQQRERVNLTLALQA